MAGYLKIPTDFFDMKPISTISSRYDASRDTIILLYLDLLCETHKGKRGGTFRIGNIVLTDDAIQSVFRYDNIGKNLAILEKYGLVKRYERRIEVLKFWVDSHDRNSDQYRRWRSAVFSRDGFRCQKCGSKCDIQAHHIKTWSRNKLLRYDVSNGITLCRKCHLESHGGCWRNGE